MAALWQAWRHRMASPGSESIAGIRQLPRLPGFTESRAWHGETVHRIELSKAGDSPGYRSLLSHKSGVQGQDDENQEKVFYAIAFAFLSVALLLLRFASTG